MSKPSPALIDSMLVEMLEVLEENFISVLRVSPKASEPTKRLVINLNYADDAYKLAEECGLPVSINRCEHYGIAVIEPVY